MPYDSCSHDTLIAAMTANGGEPTEYTPGPADVALLQVYDDRVALPEFIPDSPSCEACGATPARTEVDEYTWRHWRCPACGGWNDRFPAQ